MPQTETHRTYFDERWRVVEKDDPKAAFWSESTTVNGEHAGESHGIVEHTEEMAKGIGGPEAAEVAFNRVLTAVGPRADLRALVDGLKTLAPWLSEDEAMNVARTELSGIASSLAEANYSADDPGTWVYRWEGPMDLRTSPTCRYIAERQGNGLPLANLKALVEEASRATMGPGWSMRPWIPHPQCRRVLIRIVQ